MNSRNSSTSLLRRTSRWCKAALLGAAFALVGTQANATVATNGGSGLAPTYPDLATALAALPGTMTSNTVITLTSNETAPAGGWSLTQTGTASFSLTLDGGGFTVTAPTPQASGVLHDALIEILGGDYITIQNFVMRENNSNTTTAAGTNNMTEWGVAVFYATATNGSQNISILNNNIDLDRTYQNTSAIYVNATHTSTVVTTSATATGATGGNHNLVIRGNVITDVNMGIIVIGPAAAADQNTTVDIGGATAPEGNTITNFGTTGTFSGYANVSGTVNGILLRNTRNYTISRNTVTSSNGGVTAGTLNGIQVAASSNAPTGTLTQAINNNTLSLRPGASVAINGINVPSSSVNATTTCNINSNDFNTFGHTVAATSAITFITQGGNPLTQTFNSNTFTNMSVNTTGTITFFSFAPTMISTASLSLSSNLIVTGFTRTGVGSTTVWSTNASSVPGSTHAISSNNFSNITLTGASSFTGISDTDGPTTGGPTKTVNSNTFNNITTGAGTVAPMSVNFSSTGTTVNGNTITNITTGNSITGLILGSSNAGTSAANGNTISGLNSAGTTVIGLSVAGITPTVNKNKICDLNGSVAGSVVTGLVLASSTTNAAVNASNNIIGNLTAPIATGSNAIRGIDLTGVATTGSFNLFYNTVYLNNTTSGAGFGSSAIQVATSTTATTSALDMRNNIFVNTSVQNGAGLTVAYRRTLGTASNLANYASTSNRNLFYAGAPGVSNLIYADGTSTAQTLAAYKAGVFTAGTIAPRDAASVTENPPFLSTACGNANFLHMSTVIATGAESGGATVSITDDFDGQARGGTPDIGADEFAGTALVLCMGTPATSTITGPAAVCTGSGTTLALSTLYTDLLITYQWRSGTVSGGPYGTTLGTSATQATGPLTVPTYYICEVTCNNGGTFTMTTVEKSVLINALPTVTVNGVAAATGTYCTPGGAPATLTAGGAATYTWSPTAGLTPTSGSPVSAAPVATTTYTVTGTDVNGCVGTATAAITVAANPVINSTTATPNPACFNGNSTLAANVAGPGAYCTTLDFTNTVESISLVQFAGINNPSTCGTGGTEVENFTAISGNVTAGSVYPITLSGTTDGNFTTYFTAFFDWDRNGTYETAVPIGTITNTACVLNATNNVTVPVGAVNGTTRMRIIKDFVTGAAQPPPHVNYPSNPCGTYDFGQAEDYSIIVTGGVDAYTYVWSPSAFIAGQETLANPVATGINVASQAYTVTVTGSGCSTTGTVTVTTTAPITAASITGTLSYCAGGSTTLTAVPADGAGPYTYAWTGPSGPAGTAVTQVANAPGSWSVVVSDGCGGTAPSTGVTVIQNALPSVAIVPVPANAAICAGVGNVVMTASGASTYTWLPVTALAPTSGATVTSTATTTTTYTVTGTDANSCTSTATQTVNVGPNPVMGAVSASPNPVCQAGTSNLSANATIPGYTIGATGSTFIDISVTGTSVGPAADDSEHNITIPSFTFNGTAYTTARVGNNGLLVFGSTSGEIVFGNVALPSTANSAGNIFLAPWWDDLDTSTVATTRIRTETVGDLHIIQWTNSNHDDLPAAQSDLITFQVQLNVVTGVIYFAYSDVSFGSAPHNAGVNATVGIQFSGSSALQSSFNTASLSDGQVISFTPNQPAYSWLPVTYLTGANTATPTATNVQSTVPYTVTATSPIGCTSTGTVTLTMTPQPSGTFSYTGSPYCSNGGTASPTGVALTAGGTYSSAGGLSINGASGDVNLALSTAGTYTVTYTIAAAGGCAAYAPTATITVTAAPSGTFSYATPYCSNAGTASVTPVALTGGGTYSGAPAGLSINSASGDVDLALSTAGTYTVTYTIAAAGGCAAFTPTATISITAAPNAGVTNPAFNICIPGASVNLFSALGGTPQTGGSWTGPSPALTGGYLGTFQPGTNVLGTYTYTKNAVSPCVGSVSAQVTVTNNNLTTVTVDIRSDFESDEVSWEIVNQNNNTVICNGGGYPEGITAPITENCCLTTGCYRLRVSESGGDGMVSLGYTGGYQLVEAGPGGRRIIDNVNNFSNLAGGPPDVSAISNVYDNGAFCVPVGSNQPVFQHCDKLDWANDQLVALVATEDIAVSAAWTLVSPPSDYGYEFWWFDPNGTYSFRRFRSHATSDGYSPNNAQRACKVKINGWANAPLTPWLAVNKLYNVRIRARYGGSNYSPFGPACRFKINPAAAACPPVKLQDNPANVTDFSCGVSRYFGAPNGPGNRIYANPPQPIPAVSSSLVRYQFRFRNGEYPAAGGCIVRPPQTSAQLTLNWTALSGTQLKCNTQYTVDVRVSVDGGATWCVGHPTSALPANNCADPGDLSTAWGKLCTVNITTSPNCGPLQGGGNNLAEQGPGIDGGLTMYPNPNRGDQLFISLSEVAADVHTVSVDIYDMTGKKVTTRTIAVQDGYLKTALDLNGDLSGGMYLVNITAGDKAYTERLVIQP